jgi:hypothetical protein
VVNSGELFNEKEVGYNIQPTYLIRENNQEQGKWWMNIARILSRRAELAQNVLDPPELTR